MIAHSYDFIGTSKSFYTGCDNIRDTNENGTILRGKLNGYLFWGIGFTLLFEEKEERNVLQSARSRRIRRNLERVVKRNYSRLLNEFF